MRLTHIIGGVALTALAACWIVIPTHSPAEVPHFQVSSEWIHEVQRSLHQAAAGSPKWHSKRRAVQSHVRDISLLLDLAWKATRRADHKTAGQHARQAVALIERAVRKDYLRQDDAAQILAKIRRAWPESSI